MIPRSILLAEDLDQNTDQGQRRGQTVRGVAKAFSRLLSEDLNSISVQVGSPSEEILTVVRRWPRPEMIIMGTQGRTGIEKLLDGSVAESVLLKSVRPVMVVGPRAQEKNYDLKKTKHLRILVPTDLTRESRPAEEYAMSLAARTGSEMILFHSVYEKVKRVHDASIVSGFVGFDMDRVFQKMQKDAKASLMEKTLRIRKSMVECGYLVSNPNKSLSEVIKEEMAKGYNLVVMGTHGKRNALLRSFLGSTARNTILQSEVPVVIVHSH